MTGLRNIVKMADLSVLRIRKGERHTVYAIGQELLDSAESESKAEDLRAEQALLPDGNWWSMTAFLREAGKDRI